MNETFGQALRRLRGSRSLRDVAALAACGKSYIADLENGRRFPSREIAAALDQALGARGELIALADIRPDADPLEQADALQRGLHETLTAGPLSDYSLDEVEYTVARHGRATRYRAEAELLPELLADFGDLRLMLSGRQSQPVRKRLTIAVARMSGLMALTLLKLGDGRSRGWWRTGRAAAAAAEDRATLSWMYAQEAYQLYYGGDLEGAVELACRAQHLAGGLPCVGPALAAPLEARAHALLGRRDETSTALAEAETALGRLAPGTLSPPRLAIRSLSFDSTVGTRGRTLGRRAGPLNSRSGRWSCIRSLTIWIARSCGWIRRCVWLWRVTPRGLLRMRRRPSWICRRSTGQL
jgi:transcriptional regulator with XRE-family HTH domain